MNLMKLIKKKMTKICCCTGCLQQATCVFGVLDICFAAYAIYLATSFYNSRTYKIDFYQSYISESTNFIINIIIIIIMVINSLNIVSCILLLYGNQSEKRRNYLIPYVVIGFIRLLCILFMIVLLIFWRNWEILLYCLFVIVYVICSLHVVGERDKELDNQLNSKVYPTKPSSNRITIGHFDIKQPAKPVSPGKPEMILRSSKIKSYHLKEYTKECEELRLKKIFNYKTKASLSTINSNTLSSSLDYVSDYPELSTLPLSIKFSKSTLPAFKSHRHKSSISLINLDAAIPESKDPLLTKSVADICLSSSPSRRLNSCTLGAEITNSKLIFLQYFCETKGEIQVSSPMLPRPQSPISLTRVSESVDPLLTKSVADLHLSSSMSPILTSKTLGKDISSSRMFLVQNPCVSKGDMCKKIEVDVINEESCKLCQLCPSSCDIKGNVSDCKLQKCES